MSTNGKSKKRSRNPNAAKRDLPLDRPFDPAILRRAQEIVAGYTLVVFPEPGLGYMGHTIELPYAMGDGKTIALCAEQVRQASVAVVATLLEKGESPPEAAGEERRTEQVNIRLSAFEKMKLESQAKQQGFRSISDYIRTAALNRSA